MAIEAYRKAALVMAEQFRPELNQIPDGVISDGLGDPRANPLHSWVLDTLEGRHTLRAGDYICTGAAGEKWNVAREIFEATYEKATATEVAPTLAARAISDAETIARLREALAPAYEAGAIAVHAEWVRAHEAGEVPPRGEPDFTEASRDYAAALTEDRT